jgi:hypothetical protein
VIFGQIQHEETELTPDLRITAAEMKQVNIYPDKFHGEWNYVIKPHRTAQLVP